MAVGTITYLMVSAVVLYACIQIDKAIIIDMSFLPGFKEISYRLSPELPWPFAYLSEPPASRISYTSNLSIGMLIYFLIQAIMGFTYVNLVTLQNVRKDPFFTKRERNTKNNPYLGLTFYQGVKIAKYQDI